MKPPQSPTAANVSAWAAFFAVILLGFLIARYVVDRSLSDLPRTEVYEALHRDGLAVKFSCFGWFVTLAAATAIAIVTKFAFKFTRTSR